MANPLTARLAAAVLFFASSGPVVAGSDHWMFKPSYYSHDLPPEVLFSQPLPTPVSDYRLPYVGQNPGFAVRSRFRINRFTLRNGRNSVDTEFQFSGGVEFLP